LADWLTDSVFGGAKADFSLYARNDKIVSEIL